MRKVLSLVVGALLLLVAAVGTATGAAAQDGTHGKDGKRPPGVGAPTAPPPRVSPQSAANQIVQGAGVTHDDLSDEATLRNGGTYWNGNYAGFWQTILWADGVLASDQVDCEFGPITASATAAWQRIYGLGDDGVVGPLTRGQADEFLIPSSGTAYNVYYAGFDDRRVYLFREAASHYWIWWGGQWQRLDYNAKTIPGC